MTTVDRPGLKALRRSLSVSAGIVCLGALLAPEGSLAQSRPRPEYSVEAERLFVRGLERYDDGNYESAREHFQKLVDTELNQRSSAAGLMLSKSMIRLGEHEAALQVAKRMERDFKGRYTPDIRLVLGDCFYHLRRYYEAADRYGRLLATVAPLHLQASAAERLTGIIRNGYITAQAVDSIRLQVGETRLRDALMFGEARWYARLGWHEESRSAMQAYVAGVKDGIFKPLAIRSLRSERPERALAQRSEPKKSQTETTLSEMDRLTADIARETQELSRRRPEGKGEKPRLGVVLPLSGPERQYGEEILAGVRLANEEHGEPFEIIAEDTGSDYGDLPIFQSESSRLIKTVQAVKRLVGEWEVQALIGPIFSSSCVAAASVADAAGVPLIAPLAQQSGLDSLGQSIFQLSIIPETQGSALAEHATLVLGLETFAVLAPLSDYGWSFERSFARTAETNGGTVVHKEWYVPLEAKDFQHQFKAIRQVGFSLMPAVSADSAMFDSLSFAVLDSSIDGDDLFLELLESQRVESPADSSEIFIDSIDGIVVVGESFEDIRTIVPQLRFHRLEAQVMGNEVWNEPEQLRYLSAEHREYLKESIFVSGRSATESTRDFVDTFRSRFNSDPGFAAAGYDAARIVITGWEEGRRSRPELREWLAQLRHYEGVGGWISFADGRRSNIELSLLKIDGRGQVKQLLDLPEISLPMEDLPSVDLWDLESDLESEFETSPSDSTELDENFDDGPAGLEEDSWRLETD